MKNKKKKIIFSLVFIGAFYLVSATFAQAPMQGPEGTGTLPGPDDVEFLKNAPRLPVPVSPGVTETVIKATDGKWYIENDNGTVSEYDLSETPNDSSDEKKASSLGVINNPEPGNPNATPTPAQDQALGLSGGAYTNQEKIPGAEPTAEFIPYVKSIINFGFAVIGILALFMLIIGAYQYLMAAGSGKAEGAKETITSALLGLILGLCAWVILYKINPDLVKMNPISQISGGSAGGSLVSGTQGAYSSIKPPANLTAALKQYDGLITQAADKYGVDRNIARAMMWVESSGNPEALSSKGAGGLYQIMPKEWAMLTGTDISQRKNIPLNIDTGVKYTSQKLQESKGNVADALGRYNGGPNWQGKSESRNFVSNVIGIANGLKSQGYN